MRGLAAAGERAGAAAVKRAAAGVAARVAAGAPEIAVVADDGAVRLTAPRLTARVFGSRRRVADPRLALLARGL